MDKLRTDGVLVPHGRSQIQNTSKQNQHIVLKVHYFLECTDKRQTFIYRPLNDRRHNSSWRQKQDKPLLTSSQQVKTFQLKCRLVVCLGARIGGTVVEVNLSFIGFQRTPVLIKKKTIVAKCNKTKRLDRDDHEKCSGLQRALHIR